MKKFINSVLVIAGLAVIAPAFSAQDQMLLDQVRKSQQLRHLIAAEKAGKEQTSTLPVDAPVSKSAG